MKKIILIFSILAAVFLRFNELSSFPALNADEAALGYNAYSLLETGRDEHGNSWPIHFQSFNDYKPGLYVYLDMLFVKMWGLNEFSVRFPGALFGVLSVLAVYYLVKEIFPDRKLVAEISALYLSISPWHIHFSRGGWEVNVATLFILLGLIFFLKGTKNIKLFYFSIFFFACSLYTYHAARIVSPLLIISLTLLNFKFFFKNFKKIIPTIIFGIILLLPLSLEIFSSATISRAAGVGLLADTGPYWKTNEQRGEHTDNLLQSKLLHNKFVNYGIAFSQNYLAHFSGDFLFITGDLIQRNKVPEFGQMYLLDIIFVIFGVFWSLKNIKISYPVLLWLMFAPIAAALTFQSPHALRSQNMVIPLIILSALGAVYIWDLLKNIFSIKIAKIVLTFLIIISFWDFTRYIHEYYFHMAKNYPVSSQYGAKETVAYVSSVKDRFNTVYFTDRYDQPYILYLFYTKYSPLLFQKNHELTPKDQFGFSTVRKIENINFVSINWEKMRDERNVLLVGTDEELPIDANVVHKINFPNGMPAYEIVPL